MNVEPDELHCIHLGTSMNLLGSELFLLMFEVLAGSPKDNMVEIWNAIAKEYRKLRSLEPYTTLDISSFCDPKKPGAACPKLKVRVVRSAGIGSATASSMDQVHGQHFGHS